MSRLQTDPPPIVSGHGSFGVRSRRCANVSAASFLFFGSRLIRYSRRKASAFPMALLVASSVTGSRARVNRDAIPRLWGSSGSGQALRGLRAQSFSARADVMSGLAPRCWKVRNSRKWITCHYARLPRSNPSAGQSSRHRDLRPAHQNRDIGGKDEEFHRRHAIALIAGERASCNKDILCQLCLQVRCLPKA
jgi:hypothetical protein